MPLLPYSLARPLLFSLDAEAAHDLTLKTLARTQHTALARLYANPLVEDPVELAGLRFPNRVGLAAGLDKNARCIDAFGAMGFGFVEVGTVTPLEQPGNPKPRMFRLPRAGALINRLGFNNDGLAAFLDNVQRSTFRASGRILGLNIGKNAATPIENAVADYLTCLDGVYPHADYVTVNISSPNTASLRTLQQDRALDALLQALAERRELLAQRHGRSVPLFVKIAPDFEEDEVAAIAATLRRHGCDSDGQATGRLGVIATNTTLSRAGVVELRHASERGGLSGPPLHEASNEVLRTLREVLGASFPIIGVGGIANAVAALEKRYAGADLVQLYTGLVYRGPRLVREVANALARDPRRAAVSALDSRQNATFALASQR